MTTSIFSNHAPAYWAAGFSVVPVTAGTKQPAITKWSGYCDNLPGERRRQDWLRDYATHGIGVLLGTELARRYRLIAIDIDDEQFSAAICALLPPTCAKVGRKGITIFAKTPAEAKIKSTTLKGPSGHIGDLLASGRLTVIPPTLHPETGAEYRWIGTPLIEMGFQHLPVFDARAARILHRFCNSEHILQLRTGEATHMPALQLIAQLLRAGASDDEIKGMIEATLPSDYAGDTLEQVSEMIRSARDKGFAAEDNKDTSPTLAIQIVDACQELGIELFRHEDRAFVSFPTPQGGCLTYPVRGRATERRIRHIWYARERRSMGPMILSEVIATLETKAFAEGPTLPVWNRVGEVGGEIFVDLGRDDALLVRISATGWETCYEARAKFRRPDGFREIAVPQGPGDLRGVQALLGLSEEAFFAVAAFMISCMGAKGPYFGLVIEGEMGSGKSVLASTLKALLDPSDADRLTLPTNDRDLAIHANQFRLLSYDNASGIKSNISDLLCIVATGGGIATRKLYTDEDLAVLKTSRPFILNGISGYARRPDLLERVIYVHLERVPPESRREERELEKEFARLAPTILAGLYDAVAEGLRGDNKVLNPTGLRMADAARRIAASEPALNLPAGTLIAAIREGQSALVIERVSADALTIALRSVLERGTFEGTIKDLHSRMREEDGLPKSPAGLSILLERQRSALREVGISVAVLQRGKQGRRVRVEYVGPPEDAPKPSGMFPTY